MYKLMIVDDEAGIRSGIKNLLPWELYGIEICAEAEDGKQALELFEKLRPEIIITDICMPNMDGIELVKQTAKRSKVIVLSGYNDFHLVRQAMRYGAIDYILKPSGKDEFLNIVEEIIDSIEDKYTSRIMNSEHMKLLKNNVLNRVIHNNISSRELREKTKLLEIDLSKGELCTGIIELCRSDCNLEMNSLKQSEQSEKQEVWKTFAVSNICEEIAVCAGKGVVFSNSEGQILLIFYNIKSGIDKEQVRKLLERCLSTIRQLLKLEVTIALGNYVHTFRELYQSYEKAVKSLEYNLVFGRDGVLFYEEIEEYLRNSVGIIEFDVNKLKDLIEDCESEAIDEFVHKIFCRFENCEVLVKQHVLRSGALEILLVAFQVLAQKAFVDRDMIRSMKEGAMNHIFADSSVSELEYILTASLSEIIGYMRNSQKKHYSKLVFDTVQIMEEQYSNPDLSLQYLSDEYHMNCAYLGRIFKKETRCSFSDYLNMIRIKKAQELLIHTNYKGSELCAKVGFTSYNYFYIVFKKITGKTPMDIRR